MPGNIKSDSDVIKQEDYSNCSKFMKVVRIISCGVALLSWIIFFAFLFVPSENMRAENALIVFMRTFTAQDETRRLTYFRVNAGGIHYYCQGKADQTSAHLAGYPSGMNDIANANIIQGVMICFGFIAFGIAVSGMFTILYELGQSIGFTSWKKWPYTSEPLFIKDETVLKFEMLMFIISVVMVMTATGRNTVENEYFSRPETGFVYYVVVVLIMHYRAWKVLKNNKDYIPINPSEKNGESVGLLAI